MEEDLDSSPFDRYVIVLDAIVKLLEVVKDATFGNRISPQAIQDQSDVGAIGLQEFVRLIGFLRLSRCCEPAERPFAVLANTCIDLPEVRDLGILVRVLSLRKNGLVE